MSLFSASSLKNSLSLPLKSAVSDKVGQVAEKLTTDAIQKVKDFASVSDPVKQAEALLKMKQSGVTPEFDSLTRRLDIIKSNNSMVVADSMTKKQLAEVAEAPSPSAYASDVSAGSDDQTQYFKVKIWQDPPLDETGGMGDQVTFDVMPTISESRQATYDTFTPLHHPGEILKFKSTSARSWTVTAKLTARNSEEASKNLIIVNTIRSWVMPFYGKGTMNAGETSKYLGAPPPILTLQAYGEQMIGPVKCIMEMYDWRWPNDVDYIKTNTGVPFPVVLDLTLTLKESWSPAEYSGFDLIKYRNGRLPDAFNAISASQQSAQTPQVSVPRPSDVSTAEPVSASSVPTTAKQETSRINTDNVSGATADYVTSTAPYAAP